MIVEQWLRPLNLQHYTQAFLDNGYDDLEVCKQIGEPDLDAIGVLDLEHRKRILDAVEALQKEGESAVYFTLENPDYECYACNQQRSNVDPGAAAGRQDPQPYLSRRSFFTYPRLQLTALLQERLFEDDVRLAERPYTDEVSKIYSFIAMTISDDLKMKQKHTGHIVAWEFPGPSSINKFFMRPKAA